jgi:hypothetical protein
MIPNMMEPITMMPIFQSLTFGILHPARLSVSMQVLCAHCCYSDGIIIIGSRTRNCIVVLTLDGNPQMHTWSSMRVHCLMD